MLNDMWMYHVVTGKWTWLKPGTNFGRYPYPYIPSARYGHSGVYVGLKDTTTYRTFPEGEPVFRKYLYIYGGFSFECTTSCKDLWRYEIQYGPYNMYPKNEEYSDWHNFGNHWTMLNDGNSYGPGSRWRQSMIAH